MDSIYSTPTSDLDTEYDNSRYLAIRSSRLIAIIIDGVFAGVILMILSSLMGSRLATDPIGSQSGWLWFMVLVVVGVGLIAGPQSYFLHRSGQTIGKKIMGIKVVLFDGSKPSLATFFFLRYLPLAILSGIPYIGWISIVDPLVIFRRDRRCIHDHLAKTDVIWAPFIWENEKQ